MQLAQRLPVELIALTRATCYARPLSTSARRFTAPPAADSRVFVTTPIFYCNADPHIGHLHSTLLADVYGRFSRLRNPLAPPPVVCTGTDEHGLKIQRVAEERGMTPQELCDGVSPRFKDLADAANVGYTHFIRTTEERHKRAVDHIWRELNSRGFIYKSSYAGWYAVSDEAYYTRAQVMEVVDPKTGEKHFASIESGSRVEWMEEDNYKFRLSAFRERLIEWLSSSPNPLQPSSRTTALLASLSPADVSEPTDLADLSISRPSARLTWGIPVPDDPDHTIYVWIDALVNYLTVAGYPWKGGEAYVEGQVWPPDLMIVGKDIIRFHALYLPAVLMALDLPLPKHLLAHGHWTMDKFKMSKSRGNVANPFEAMKLWGTDAMRMYLMRAGGNSAADADYSATEIEAFYKKSLAGQMGNLLSRISNKKLIEQLSSPAAIYTAPTVVEPEDERLVELLTALPTTFDEHMATFDVHRALASVFDVLAEANRHIQLLAPWLADASPSSMHRSLFYESETLRITGILLQPFMPEKSKQLLDTLGVSEERRGWPDLGLGEGGERTMMKGKLKQLFPNVKLEEVKA
ncbi:methionyl-tRNA synthetase [Leucosporidium creatinivorum]|uniref:Probable methionine--tRNA ligase, mitochondrial n=1 Tax=Leucosporidium creatinivorum TaxID=106004 RepID=A0A1Y2D876_9BASI|nr:methionyl-tRNA synthetase [Leucosporidium creatinivorum]